MFSKKARKEMSKRDLRLLSSKKLGSPIAQTPNEVAVLKKYAGRVAALGNQCIIVEIGTRNGGTALVFAMNSFTTVVTIDILDDPRLNPEMSARFGYKYIPIPLKHYWKRFPGGSRIEQVTANSNEYNWMENDGRPIGLLFIDGGHEYEECRADWINFVDGVVPGGYVILHDYEEFPGVTKFVDEDVAYPIIDRGDSVVVFQIPRDEEG